MKINRVNTQICSICGKTKGLRSKPLCHHPDDYVDVVETPAVVQVVIDTEGVDVSPEEKKFITGKVMEIFATLKFKVVKVRIKSET